MGYRVAIAGCHRMVTRPLAGHNFASAFAAVPETEIVAVFDLGAPTRAAFVQCWGDMPAYDDYAQMLQEVQPDLLCIATRQTMHADQIEQAVAAGVRGILCDKPLATALEEGDRILAACQAQSVPLLFALDRRWHAPYQFLRQQIANELVGSVKQITAYGLPNLINHGCHWYDTALMLVGDPEPIWASGLVDDVSGDPPDARRRLDPAGSGQIGLSNGAILSVMAAGGPRPAFDVLGDQGRLLILNDGANGYLYRNDAATAGLQMLDLPPATPDWPAGPAMVRDLVNAVATATNTSCDIDQARRANEIGFALHLSHAQHGRRITLPASERALSIPSFPWGNE
ncbi:MAG: Gfo/Idh/MocA family oxidoreductase [Caldilineaceae bacterium]|nr:Gfo/Idh/MocA family oxidoreductase [Caldilineaceae bacterium]